MAALFPPPTEGVRPIDLPRGALPAVAEATWTVRLLGAVEAQGATQKLTHWPSRAVATLLAQLALAPERAHPREQLIESLWPGVSLEVGRNRLRQALSTLKSLLEPPAAEAQAVLLADRLTVCVVPGALACDAQQFESALRNAQPERARALYQGELMPGYFDDWVVQERLRLAALFDRLGPAPSAPLQSAPATASEASVTPPPSGLPSYWTRIFGAELPASRLRALVQTQRLVTVHGPGGSGKTRLAAEVAHALREAPGWQIDDNAPPFARVSFISMVACSDTVMAMSALCDALRIDGREGGPHARIVAALTGWPTLLVLDNLEQLGDAIGPDIARLLAALPALHVLATSRLLLGIDGEIAFELDGLPVPPAKASLTEAAESAAVSLFVDRARAVRADFQLSARNAAAIVALVRLLAGMPLAIELAASRVRGLTPQELLKRLSEGAGTPMLDLLTRGAHRASPQARHASMRHVMAWSWQQLSPAQAALLEQMSVLAAPACADAVAAMVAADVCATQWLLDALHDASLLHTSTSQDETTRYQLLQPVREFAGERLDANDGRRARQRLRHWLIGYARAASGNGPLAIAPELAHIHGAIVSAVSDGLPREALELALALRVFWETDALPLSGLLALESALADVTDEADTDLRADALELLAFARGAASFAHEALAHAQAGLAAARDDRRRCLALVRWVTASYMTGSMDGDAFEHALEEAAGLARRAEDTAALATVLRMQALVASNIRLDFVTSEALSAQSLALWESVGNRSMALVGMLNLAVMWAWTGRVDKGIAAHLDCERAMREEHNWVGQSNVARQLGRIYVRARRWDEGEAAFRRSMRVAWQRQYAFGIAHALLHLPDAMVTGSQPEAAARLHGFAVAHWDRLYSRLNRIEAQEMRRTRRRLRLRLGAGLAQALIAEGSRMSLRDAAAMALDDVSGTADV